MSRKPIFSYGAVALAAAVLTLAAPRAAHGLAAALVQVTNTAVNPAVTQSPDTQAAQLVRLSAGYISPAAQSLALNPLNTVFLNQAFTVPANQSLATTSVDITPLCASTVTIELFGVSQKDWVVTGPNTSHFEYLSGLVIGPGIAPSAYLTPGSPCVTSLEVTGYLTSN